MILSQDHTLYQLLSELQTHFDSFEDMRKKVLAFVDIHALYAQDFINATDISELFSLLLKNKQCLTCLLKEYGLDRDRFLDKYDEDCEALKRKALSSHIVTSIIMKITPKTGKNLAECRVAGWLHYNTDNYEPLTLKKSVMNFTQKGNYTTELPELLEENLKGRNYASPLALRLILHEDLFEIDFKILELDEDEPLIDTFHITTQFDFRYENFYKPIHEITTWKTNSQRYKEHQRDKVKALIYPLDAQKPNGLFAKRFNSSPCVVVISNYTLLNENLTKVLKHGLPHIVCPQTTTNVECPIEWKDTTVQDMRGKILDCIDEAYENQASIHFLYDNYFDVEKLKQATYQTNDNNYDDLKGG